MSNLNPSPSPSILAFAQAPNFEVGNPVVFPAITWDNYYLLWIYCLHFRLPFLPCTCAFGGSGLVPAVSGGQAARGS